MHATVAVVGTRCRRAPAEGRSKAHGSARMSGAGLVLPSGIRQCRTRLCSQVSRWWLEEQKRRLALLLEERHCADEAGVEGRGAEDAEEGGENSDSESDAGSTRDDAAGLLAHLLHGAPVPRSA